VLDTHLHQLVRRLQARVFAAVYLGTLTRLLLWSVLALGSLVLLLRLGFEFDRSAAAWAFAPLALVPLAAWILARRRALSAHGAVAWLDVHGGADGALVAHLEHADPRWQPALEQSLARLGPLPGARLARPLARLAPAVLFAAAALWIELPRDPVLPPRKLEEAAIERLAEKLETLEEVATLEPELAQELETRLERLEDEAGSPEEAFEAIDQLEARLAQEAERLAEELRAAQEALDTAGISQAQDPEAAQDALESALGALASAGLGQDLAREKLGELGATSLELPPGTQLTPEQMKALDEALRAGLESKLGKLAKAGLAQPGKLRKAGELATLEGFEPTGHVCTEECGKKPGGT